MSEHEHEHAPLGPPADSEAGRLAAERARAAWESRFLPTRARCPRCGERFGPEAAAADEPPPCPRCATSPLAPLAGAGLVPHGSWVGELLRGASYFPRGLLHLVRHPRLWKWATIPALLNAIAILVAFALALLLADWLLTETSAEALSDWTGWFWGTLSWPAWALGRLVSVLGFLAIPLSLWLIVAFPPFALIYKILFMPFMELLAEGAEQEALGIEDASRFELSRFYANVVIAILDAVLLTLLQALLWLLLLPINLVPILGNLVWVGLPPALFAGMDYTDIDLIRRGYPTREKVRLWAHHHWRFLGFGLSFCFLAVIPVVNMVIIPAAAVGGSLLYLELDRK